MHSLRSPRSLRAQRLLAALLILSGAGTLHAQLTLTGQLVRSPPPNILLLIADDLGVEGVGAYAEHPDPPRTPNIDALAANGLLFRNAWANPGCSPTRATMLTGRYSFRTGIGQAVHYVYSPIQLAKAELGIPERLGFNYRSAALGKWHLALKSMSGPRHPSQFGFDVFKGSMKILPGFISDAYDNWPKVINGTLVGSTKYATTDTVDDALTFIAATPDPWLLWVAFHAPHAPFHKPPSHLHTYNLPPNVLDDVSLHMYAMTEALDTEIGRLLASMSPSVRANTVIIFIGDNGSPSSVTVPPWDPKHAKNTVYEGGLNVPLIVSGRGVARGAECAGLINSTDIFATILDIAGANELADPDAPPLDSVSFTPYFKDPERPSLRPWVYAEHFLPNGFNPTTIRRAMREERFKLIQSLYPSDGSIDEELYDLLQDPFETTNLLDSPPLHSSTKKVLTMLRDEFERLDPFPPKQVILHATPTLK